MANAEVTAWGGWRKGGLRKGQTAVFNIVKSRGHQKRGGKIIQGGVQEKKCAEDQKDPQRIYWGGGKSAGGSGLRVAAEKQLKRESIFWK